MYKRQLKKIFKEAINHKGFALIDVLQVCVTFYNMYEYYDKRTYELKDHNPQDYSEALNKIREWNYHDDSKIALGVFYKKEAETFEQRMSSHAIGGLSDNDFIMARIIDEIM